MIHARAFEKVYRVALRTEGVDRNAVGGRPGAVGSVSPSARRAWIEI